MTNEQFWAKKADGFFPLVRNEAEVEVTLPWDHIRLSAEGDEVVVLDEDHKFIVDVIPLATINWWKP